MSLISIGKGYTKNLGDFNSKRVDFRIDNVDTDLPIEPQIEVAKEYITTLSNWLSNFINEDYKDKG
tara:strand:- start:5402 stop:5599 length:198 start_codon:yes stop_codon:yes gene_type:complete